MIRFTKMHGLGNDFVVIDAVRQSFAPTPEQIRFLADRHFGVGCDQVLLVEPPTAPEFDFRYRIFNADGGEVEQCGNGARCFARFVRDQGLTEKDRIRVETAGGPAELLVLPDGQVRVDMGRPRFEPAAIPFQAGEIAARYELAVDDRRVEIGVVSLGNPHAVLQVEDIDAAPVATLGAAIERHARFPRRVNVGFMQVVDSGRIRLRVFERGAGETLACGSGACAAVVIGRHWGLLDETARVELPGGEVVVSWAGDDAPVYLAGPATRVYEGQIDL